MGIMAGGAGGSSDYPGVSANGRTPAGLNINGGINVNGGNSSFEVDDDGNVLVGAAAQIKLLVTGEIDGPNFTLNADGSWSIGPTGNVSIDTSGQMFTTIPPSFSTGMSVWGHTAPGSQPTLATGASHTVDDVIALLQLYGICKQS